MMRRTLARIAAPTGLALALVAGLVPGLVGLTGVASANTLRATPPVASNTNTAFTVTLTGATPVSNTTHTAQTLRATLVGPRGYAAGDQVTINGTSVTQTGTTAKATFDLVTPKPSTLNSSSDYTNIPADPGVYDLYLCDSTVFNCLSASPAATSVDTGSIVVFGDAPAVTSFTPTVRARGTYTYANAVIKGSGFSEKTTWQFLDSDGNVDPGILFPCGPCGSTSTPAKIVRSGGDTVTANFFRADATAKLGAHSVRVNNPDGTSATLANAFSIEEDMTITSIAPSSFGAGSTRDVTINGTNLPTGTDLSYTIRTNTTGSPVDTSVTSSIVSSSSTALILRISTTVKKTDFVSVSNVRTGAGKSTPFIDFTTPPTFSSTSVPRQAPDTATFSPGQLGRGGSASQLRILATAVTAANPPAVVFGDGLKVTHGAVSVSATADSESNFTVFVNDVVVAQDAPLGAMNVRLTNPDGGTSVCTGCFTVLPGPIVKSAAPSHVGLPLAGSKTTGVQIVGDYPASTVATNVDPITGARLPARVNVSIFQGGTQIGSASNQAPTALSDGIVNVNVTVSPSTPTGPYVVRVSSVEAAGGVGSCSLCFTVDAFEVNAVTPGFSANTDGTKTLTISGSALPVTGSGPVTVTLTHDPILPDQPQILGSSVVSTNQSTLTAIFDLRDVAPGFYNVRVEGTNTSGQPVSAICSCLGSNNGFYVNNDGRPATITSLSPPKLTQGQQNVLMTITGTNIFPGATVAAGGASGITIVPGSTERIDSTSIRFRVSVASNATPTSADPATARQIRLYDYGTDPANAASTPLVVKVAPTVTKITPSTIGQGSTRTGVLIEGTDIPDSAVFSFPTASGSAGDLQVPSGTLTVAADRKSATMTVVAADGAEPGGRDVVLTDSETGFTVRIPAGSASGLSVTGRPVITSVSPAASVRGRTATLTVNGSSFATSGTPTLQIRLVGADTAEAGYTFSDVVVNAAGTQLTATVTIPATVPKAPRTVVVTNPDGGVGLCSTCFRLVDVPEAPVVTTAPGDGQVQVSWTKPADGGAAISGYTLNAVPQSSTGTAQSINIVGSNAGSRVVTGLVNGAPYVFTVRAINAGGPGAVGSSAQTTPVVNSRLVSIKPKQIVNSSTGLGTPGGVVGRLQSNGSAPLQFDVPFANVPSAATGAVVSVEILPSAVTYVKLYGTGTPAPASVQAYGLTGIAKSGTAFISFGAVKSLHVTLYGGPATVVINHVAWQERLDQDGAAASAEGGRFVPTNRVLTNYRLSSTGPVPQVNPTFYYDFNTSLPDVDSIALQVSTSNSRSRGTVIAYAPEDGPVATSHTFTAGRAATTFVVSRVSKVDTPDPTDPAGTQTNRVYFKVKGQTGLLVSMVGYWAKDNTAFTGHHVTVPMQRLLTASQPRGGEIRVRVPDSVPTATTGVLLAITAWDTASSTVVRAYPDGGTVPAAYTLSYVRGDKTTNVAIVGVGANRYITLKVYGGTTKLYVDLMGYVN